MELSSICSQESSPTLYFLLPLNCKPEQCQNTLKLAYQVCTEYGFDPIWLSSEECLHMIPTTKDVFVCDPFEGEAFNFITSGTFKCVVLGPRCLLSCLYSKNPIPELRCPLHNMAMHKIVVTTTGFEKDEKLNLIEMIEKMCGIFCPNFHEGITHLIAKTVLGKKYLTAVAKGTTIMTEEWVEAVWKASNGESYENISATDEKFMTLTCPVFRGLVICVSQLPRPEKNILWELIEKNGGTYAANMDVSSTSILITSSTDGEKYKYAVKWKIPCVSPQWIHESVESGSALPLDSYKVKGTRKASTPIKDQSIKGHMDVSACSTIMNESSMNFSRRMVNETNNDDNSSFFLKSTADAKETASAIESVDLQGLNKGEPFLKGCTIFLSGINSNLNEKIRRILSIGRATVASDLNGSVTHVVVGRPVDEHLRLINGLDGKPHVVTSDWLATCANLGKLIEEDKFLYSDKENIIPTSSMKPPAKPPKVENTFVDEELMNHYTGTSESGKRGSSEKSLDVSSLPMSQGSTLEAGIFQGLVFTVSGYREQVEEELNELILENGGDVAELNTSKLVNYSIVSPDGEGVFHPSTVHYITHHYVEDCILRGELLPVEYFHMPFIWPCDSPVLDSCVITMTKYTGKERTFLGDVTNKLGALFQDVFAKKDNLEKGAKRSTHLLCPTPEGKKYDVAKSWGVPVVTKDWLLACASRRCKVSEEPYVVDKNPEELDCQGILTSLIKKAAKLEDRGRTQAGDNSFIAPTPVNKHSTSLAVIKTPDTETLRRMYPTPGRRLNDTLDEMSTPETPYGSTWYDDPPPRLRKAIKRAIDAIPDPETPYASPSTPLEVYVKKHIENMKNFVATYKLPPKPSSSLSNDGHSSAPSAKSEATGAENGINNAKPASNGGPLTGVVAYCSKKLMKSQEDIYREISDLGGEYRWTYDPSVTHFLHYGRVNDTNKEFRLAREEGKFIVTPDWVWMCRDEQRRIDESLFPHHHVPRFSLSIVHSKKTAEEGRRRGRPRKRPDCTRANDRSDEEEDSCTDDGEGEGADSSASEGEGECDRLDVKSLASTPGKLKTPNAFNTRSKSVGTGARDISSKPVSHDQEHCVVVDTQETEETEPQMAQDIDTEEKGKGSSENKEDSEEMEYLPTSAENYCFTFSGMSEDDKELYSEIVLNLGGRVIDSKHFDSSATHVIASKPTRSERILAAIAQGKWVLYKTYLEVSAKTRRFVDESEHEWGNPKATSLPTSLSEIEGKLASAAHRWRLKHCETGNAAFYRMKALIYTSKDRAAAFTRLIEAGGGEVLTKDDEEITHCFIEISKAPDIDLSLFASRGIPCLPLLYLNELILSDPPPNEGECCIEEYKDILTRIR